MPDDTDTNNSVTRLHQRLDNHSDRITRLETDVSWIKGVPADLAVIKTQLASLTQKLEGQGKGNATLTDWLFKLVTLVIGALIGAALSGLKP
jgi:hypothetical protein